MGRFAGEGKGPVGAGERAGLAPGLGLRWRASWAGVGRLDWVGLFWVFFFLFLKFLFLKQTKHK